MINLLRKLYDEFDDSMVRYIGDDIIEIRGRIDKYWGFAEVTVEMLEQVSKPEEYIIGSIHSRIDHEKEKHETD